MMIKSQRIKNADALVAVHLWSRQLTYSCHQKRYDFIPCILTCFPFRSLWIVINNHYHDFLQSLATYIKFLTTGSLTFLVWIENDSYWYACGSLLFYLCIASYKICNWQGIYSCQCGKRLYEIKKLFASELCLH